MSTRAPTTPIGDPGRGLFVFAIAYLVFLYAPVVILPIFSFNDSPFVAFPLKAFTTKWYERMLGEQELIRSLWISIKIGVIASVAATILGLLGAKAVTRYRMPGKAASTGFIMLPLFIPEIMLGISLLILVNWMGISLSQTTVVMAHVMWCTPFAMAVMTSRLEGFDRSLEEASMDLGETPWMTFWRVTFPLALPGIVSSLLLTFIVSFDEFLLSFFLAGLDLPLPVYIWGQLRFPNKLPMVLAMGSLILVASCLLVFVAERVRQIGVAGQRRVGLAT